MQASLFDSLTDPQRSIVQQTTGHLVVLAGPGSGKTHTVTAKIRHLFDSGAIPSPFRVAALTFTNAAAREMKTRLRHSGFAEWDRLSCGTYHSFCQRLLQAYGRFVGTPEDFELAPDKALAAIDAAAHSHPRFTSRDLTNRIEGCKRRGTLPEDLPESDDEVEVDFRSAYSLYQRSLQTANVLDYADLILLSSRLLRSNGWAQERVRNAYRYVVADEFQDTDSQQLDLIASLARGQASTIVADDDQSIFRWRGAVRRNVVTIQKQLGAERVVLGTNFRSDAAIVEAAVGIIAGDPEHQQKSLVAASTARGAICVEPLLNKTTEATTIADRIQEVRARGLVASDADIAIIARTRNRSAEVTAEMSKRGLAWFDRDSLGFEDSWDAHLALAALSGAVDEPGMAIRLLVDAIEECGLDRERDQDALDLALLMHKTISLASAASDPTGILDAIQVFGVIDAVSASAADARQRHLNIKRLLQSLATDVKHSGGLRESVRRFLGHDAVQVMTGHASKGREFDVVFVVGMEDGTLPFYRAVDEAELAEERRIFYVALTRARRIACLSHVQRDQNQYGRTFMKAPSRFLGAIPDHLLSDWGGCLSALAEKAS